MNPGAPNRRPLGEVQGAELHPGQVGEATHDPPQGIDFLHQMPLSQASYRWVAGHGRHGVQVEVEKEDLETHAGGGQGAFATGVPGPHDNEVIFSGINSHGGYLGVELPAIIV